jgi:copper chaperone
LTIELVLKQEIDMTLQFQVPNMACAACGTTITNAILALDPIAIVHTDPTTKSVKIPVPGGFANETQATEVDIRQAITLAGYSVA